MNSDDEYGYDDDLDVTNSIDSGDENVYEEDDRTLDYKIVNVEEIRQYQDKDITALSNSLSVSRASASILLQYYKWNASDVQEAWFGDEEKVRQTVGLLKNPVIPVQDNGTSNANKRVSFTCYICFENYPVHKMDAASCGHLFCIECLKGYLSTSINDGPGCLTLRCPDTTCKAAIDQNMVDRLASDQDKEKYCYYHVRSYVENNRNTKWCPGPGCEYAVNIDHGGAYDVKSTCSYTFCWNCSENAHRPVDCATVAKWISKNKDESENTNWILAKTKPCPSCKKPIEKNMGCMHMSCRCGCQFCWLCLQPLSQHNSRTCNGYWENNQNPDQRIRQRAKESLERYHHFYERWAANHNSSNRALEDLEKMQTYEIENLYRKNCETKNGLKFIIEAWQQIVECRRVLKWSYAYGYYIPQHEYAKIKLFEYVQGVAESALERLHHCVEKELPDGEGVSKDFFKFSTDFIAFRTKLDGLVKVTRKYFTGLVEALENGLSEVKSEKLPKGFQYSYGEEESNGFQFSFEEDKMDNIPGWESNAMQDWNCTLCTFLNVDNPSDCDMCGLPRLGGF